MSQLTGSTESLPKQFVSAMRTLFDIMDDRGIGYVKLSDIEHRWRDDRTRGLPQGVIESLQKTASQDGLLTFERFCAGLKICLLRNQGELCPRKQCTNEVNENDGIHNQLRAHRPSSTTLLDIDNTPSQISSWPQNIQNSDKTTQLRTTSMPQLITRNEMSQNGERLHFSSKPPIFGPPKPPRVMERNSLEKKDIGVVRYKTDDGKLAIENTEAPFAAESLAMISKNRGLGDGKAAEFFPQRKSRGRREPRRHTLQNGVDYNMLKRMKQIEQEKDILEQGLAAIDKAREWYLKQLAEVQEKMRYVSRMGAHVEQWTEAQQERVELQRARVLELNRQLGALADSWHRGGLSLHMNLALPPAVPNSPNHQAINASLKRQNILLTEEVTKKTERISILEREKSALLRELLSFTNHTKLIEHIY